MCAQDDTCCSEAWDQDCIDLAPGCGRICDCSAVDPELLACTKNKDCRFCDDDEDYCNGSWVCGDEGTCTPADPVTCTTDGNFGCIQQNCQPDTGICALGGSAAACDDGKACTTETCDANGSCKFDTVPDCDDPDPCVVSTSPPGELAPGVEACVCAGLPGCCSSAWTQNCVTLAIENCALFCSCESAPPQALTCTTDEECSFCDTDLCQGAWGCGEDGYCVKGPPVVCDTGGDFGCLVNTCNPLDAACEPMLRDDLCSELDGNPCTQPLCDPGTAQCTEQTVEGCE